MAREAMASSDYNGGRAGERGPIRACIRIGRVCDAWTDTRARGWAVTAVGRYPPFAASGERERNNRRIRQYTSSLP